MEFAASWKPFMKSKTSATAISSRIVVEKAPKSMPRAAAVLEHNALEHERDVQALVGRERDELVDGLQLDQLAHVLLLAEQPRDGRAHHAVGVGLERVDLVADPQDRLAVVHRRELDHRV